MHEIIQGKRQAIVRQDHGTTFQGEATAVLDHGCLGLNEMMTRKCDKKIWYI